MNDGVKILLERMNTHPEEFHGDYNKWVEVINKFDKFFTTSERSMINGALTNIRRDEFTSIIMEELLREHTPVEVDPNTFTINTTGRTGVWNGGSVTLNRPQKTLTLQDMQEEALEEFRRLYKETYAKKAK